MSYLVLARKLRPQTFGDVVAQKHAIQALQNAIKLRRLPHALLLCGSRGIGKTTIARLVAKTINCENRREGDPQELPAEPCNQCSLCQEITSGRCVDVIEIDGASNRSIEDIRELRDNVQYLPTRGIRKVYIIDEVHMLTREAFNALLKTLEEPPEHVLFTFATTEPHKIPITILSRCQRFDLKRITLSAMRDYLREIATNESLELSDTALMMISRAADGGMRDALSLMDQVIAFGGVAPSDEEVAQAIGSIDRSILHRIGQALVQSDIGTILTSIEELFSYAYDLRQLTQELARYLRDLMVVCVCEKPQDVIDLSQDELSAIQDIAQGQQPERIQQMFRLLSKAAEEIAHSNHPRLLFEMTLIQMARIQPVRGFDELLLQLNQLEGRILASGGETPPAPSTPPSHSGSSSPGSSAPPSRSAAPSLQPPTLAARTAPATSTPQSPTPATPAPQTPAPSPKTPAPHQSAPTAPTAQAPEAKAAQATPEALRPREPKPQTPDKEASPLSGLAAAFAERQAAKKAHSNGPSNGISKPSFEPPSPAPAAQASAPVAPMPAPTAQTPAPTAQTSAATAPTPAAAPRPSPAAPQEPAPLPKIEPKVHDLSPLQWEELVEKVKPKKRVLAGSLEAARYQFPQPGEVRLVFRSEQGFYCENIKSADSRKLAEELFAQEGVSLSIEVEMLEAGEEPRDDFYPSVLEVKKARHQQMLADLRAEAQAHPRIQQLMGLVPGIEWIDVQPLAQEEHTTEDG